MNIKIAAGLSALLLGLSTSQVSAANTFNCLIDNISRSASAREFVVVGMVCNSNDPIVSGTNGCTSNVVRDDAFTFNVTDDAGKTSLSILMMAYSANKRVYISTYATCPTELPNVPILYGMKVFSS